VSGCSAYRNERRISQSAFRVRSTCASCPGASPITGLYVYASRAYPNEAAPILTREDLQEHPFIGFVEELLFAPQLNYPDLIGADVEPRIRSTNVLTQLHATLSGSGLCMLPAFVASGYSTLAPVLPEQVSLTRSLHMQIHEDHRKAAHVREVAAFIVAEVEHNHSLFHAPTAPAVASRWDILRNQRL
jgi:DNA-binding transcriptional LysR family regulator